MEEGHFVSFRDKSWPLIQLRMIPTVGSKLSSWLEKVIAEGLAKSGTLGRCRGRCGVNRPTKTILEYSQMSGHHLRASFFKFGEKMKR